MNPPTRIHAALQPLGGAPSPPLAPISGTRFSPTPNRTRIERLSSLEDQHPFAPSEADNSHACEVYDSYLNYDLEDGPISLPEYTAEAPPDQRTPWECCYLCL